jgi:hypothetical protein
MKTIGKTTLALLTLLALAVFQFTACVDDDDINNPTDERAKFLGQWTVDESCVRLDYEAVIVADPSSDTRVLIENFAFPGPGYEPAYGIVSGNVITLPLQTIGDNWRVQGTGTWQGNGILWNYYIEIGADGSNCEANYR